MKKIILFVIVSTAFMQTVYPQIRQMERYELEKKNDDDYFNVLPADQDGLVIFRDTDEYRKGEGDIWEITTLDTTLTQRYKKEVAVDNRYIFKGFDLYDSKLYLIFTHSESPASDFHLVTIHLLSEEVQRYDIKNELTLELSHLTVVKDHLVLAGYMRYSPTVVTYQIGENRAAVVPGFFKDRSDIVDLRTNENATFNILTLEKTYQGYILRLRTYAPEGTMLFEKSLELKENYRLLSGKTTDFVDGNIAVTGTYGASSSNYAQGIYFAIVKPEGQQDIVRFYNFTELDHFFDYMGPKRAARIKRRIDNKLARGKEFKYRSRLLMHEVRKKEDGYILAAEIYNPQSDGINSRNYNPYYGYGFNTGYENFSNAANQNYVKRSSPLVNTDDATHFEYLESVIVKLDNQGELVWDNSIKVEDVETYSLEQIVDFYESENKVNLLYKSEENLNYKVVDQSETLTSGEEGIRLLYENDNIAHTYDGVGKTHYWYGDNFFVWGYHRVENKSNPDVENRRSVLFINKVAFE